MILNVHKISKIRHINYTQKNVNYSFGNNYLWRKVFNFAFFSEHITFGAHLLHYLSYSLCRYVALSLTVVSVHLHTSLHHKLFQMTRNQFSYNQIGERNIKKSNILINLD